MTDWKSTWSQCEAVGEARYKTWAEYRRGCLSTFGGGRSGNELEAFKHGIDTVFNLLENEFPEPYRIWKQEEPEGCGDNEDTTD